MNIFILLWDLLFIFVLLFSNLHHPRKTFWTFLYCYEIYYLYFLLFQSYADRESNDEDNYPEVEKVMMKILKLHQDLHERWYLNKTFISRNRQEIRSRFRNQQEIRSPMFSVILYDDESRLHWRYDESRLKKHRPEVIALTI